MNSQFIVFRDDSHLTAININKEQTEGVRKKYNTNKMTIIINNKLMSNKNKDLFTRITA